MNGADFSPVAVTFQAIGTLLLALVLGHIARTFHFRFAYRWAWGWAAMFLAIFSVRMFIATSSPWPWWLTYLLAQWLFLTLLVAGCRELAGRPISLRLLAYATPLMLSLAIALVVFAPDFAAMFIMEAAVVGVVAAGCFAVLGRLARRTVGWQLMRVSLALMTILYAAYVPLYMLQRGGITVPYLDSSSLADLLASVLLGLSMVLIAAEGAHRELTDAIDALQAARDQLAIKANTDPLTAALSRHALQTMPSDVHGVAVMVDVDHLKQINDVQGHAAGDDAIRVVANAIRDRIRADDLLFRWGGDEFLVIVPGCSVEQVEDRFAALDDGFPTSRGTTVTASWGAAPFADSAELDDAIREADRTMYARRVAARVTRAV